MAREQIGDFRVLDVDFFPRESHLITFRDPWSFPILFRPDCSHLVKNHLDLLAHKVCVSSENGSRPLLIYKDCLGVCVTRRVPDDQILPS